MSTISTRYIPESFLPEFPNEYSCDGVIIGAGPNGLIAGAYLVKAGLKIVICERRYEMGGGLATEEILFPGNLTNTHAIYHMMVDYLPPLRDFPLHNHALVWIKPRIQNAIVFPDGTSLLLGWTIQEGKDSLSKLSLLEGDRFEKAYREWRTYVDEILAPATYYPPLPPLELTEKLQKTPTGKKFLEMAEKSPREIIYEAFSHPKSRALFLYLTAMWGVDPEEEGMGFMVPLLVVRGSQKYYCYGGSHRFASALGREIVKGGGLILDNGEVTRILLKDGKVEGVELSDGKRIYAPIVLSSLPPPVTFFRLIKKEELPEKVQNELEPIREWQWDKWSFFTLHCVLKDPPRYRTDDPWVNEAFMVILGFSDGEEVLTYFREIKKGNLPFVGGHATCQTLFDDTLSRTGNHIAFFQICAPYHFPWEEKKEEIIEKVLHTWQNFADLSPIQIVSETPKEIEQRLPSMVYGSIKHGDYTPLQMGYFRPSESCSSTRTPISGLYLCGAGTYPGGLIIGGPGYICANTVLEDLGKEKPWEPPDHLKRFLKTYIKE